MPHTNEELFQMKHKKSSIIFKYLICRNTYIVLKKKKFFFPE